jgi:hypothetical protein
MRGEGKGKRSGKWKGGKVRGRKISESGGVLIEENNSKVSPERISSPGKGLILLGTVKGLVKDASMAEKVFEKVLPAAVALHISPEELKGIEAVVTGKIKEIPLSSYEMVYAKKLSSFGEVQVPSPSLVAIFKKARKANIHIIPLDMDEDQYAEVYTRTISGFAMVRTSLNLKRINRKKFRSSTPEDFSKEWDKAVNGKAYMKLERERELHMASEIKKALSKFEPLLCILEFERMEGILSHL